VQAAPVRVARDDGVAAGASLHDFAGAVEPESALWLAGLSGIVAVRAAVALKARLLQDRQNLRAEVDLPLRRCGGGAGHGGGCRGENQERPGTAFARNSRAVRPHQEKSDVIGRPLSAMVNGRPDGEMITFPVSRPSA